MARRVTVDGEEIHLTPTEYELLLALAKHAGRVVTHRQLLQAVWGERTVEDTGKLRVNMTYLRRKLEPDSGRPRFLTTQAGVGYRLSCDRAGHAPGGAGTG